MQLRNLSYEVKWALFDLTQDSTTDIGVGLALPGLHTIVPKGMRRAQPVMGLINEGPIQLWLIVFSHPKLSALIIIVRHFYRMKLSC